MERSEGDDKFSRDREHDYTQLSNYSPQDSPIQAPTRQHYYEHEDVHSQQPYRHERRQGSIDADSVGGRMNTDNPTTGGGVSSSKGRSIAQMIERRWKGRQAEYKRKQQEKLQQEKEGQGEQQELQRSPCLSRPSMEPESRREFFVNRIEAASQNMIRRSSANADLLIDKLSDTLNSWSTGIDGAAMPKERQSGEEGQSMDVISKNKDRGTQQNRENVEEEQEEIPLNDADDRPKRPTSSLISQDRRSWSSLAFLFEPQQRNSSDEYENEQKQQQPEDPRRTSWSERAFSFLFNRPLFSSLYNKKTGEWGTQDDVEVQGSDSAYDDIQGSFKFWSVSAATPFSSAASSPSSTKSIEASSPSKDAAASKIDFPNKRRNSHQLSSYHHDFPPPPQVRMRNVSLPNGKQVVHSSEIIPPSGVGSIERWPTESYANVARRSFTNETESKQLNKQEDEEKDEEERWFDSDPESGRVKVPPLSVPRAPDDTRQARSQSLYDTLPSVSITPTKSTRAKMRNRKKKNKEKNKYNVIYHKKHPEEDQGIPNREPRFDSDFENWKMTPESNTASRSRKEPWPESYQIKDENKYMKDGENTEDKSNTNTVSRMNSVWVAQADAMC